MPTLTSLVARAVRSAPCTARELAREASVPHTTLSRIVSGERNATVAVARAVAEALNRLGERAHSHAAIILHHPNLRRNAP